MNVVRERAEARWLPSRHHFALFRLFAFLRLRNAKPQPVRGLMLMIDRDQSAFENYAVSLWIVFTAIGYLAAEIGILLAIPAAWFVVQLPIYLIGMFTRRGNAIGYMLLYVIAALFYARATTWVRFVAWQFLGIIALNALAALLVFALRARIAALEARVCGA